MRRFVPTISILVILFLTTACNFNDNRTAALPERDSVSEIKSDSIPDPMGIHKLRSLDLDSAQYGVMTYFPEGRTKKAEKLGPIIQESLDYFEASLNVGLDFRLALMDEEIWAAFPPNSPYGLPFVTSSSPSIAVLPLEPGGVVYEFMLPLEEKVSPELRNEVAATGLSWEEFSATMVDLIGFHEVGHPYLDSYGIGKPSRWFDEFVANYFAYAFMHTEYPEKADIWDLSTRVILDAHEPTHRSLEEFEEYYSGVGVADYGWYQASFENKANALYEERGLSFLADLKEEFPKGTGTLPKEEILNRLEQIAPGFKEWARTFEKEREK